MEKDSFIRYAGMLPYEGQCPPEGPGTGHRGSVQSIDPATLGQDPGSGSIAGNLMRRQQMQAQQQHQHAMQTPYQQTGAIQQSSIPWGAASAYTTVQPTNAMHGAPVTRAFSPGGTALQGYANDFGSAYNAATGFHPQQTYAHQQQYVQQHQHAMQPSFAVQQQPQHVPLHEAAQRYAVMPAQQISPIAMQQFQPRTGRASPPSPLWAQQMAAEASQQSQPNSAAIATPQRNVAWGERPVFPHSEPDTEPVRATQWQWSGERPPGMTGRRNSAPGHLADFRAPEQTRERSREREEEDSWGLPAAGTEDERDARLRRCFGADSTSAPRTAPSTAPREQTRPPTGGSMGILSQIRKLKSQRESRQSEPEAESEAEPPIYAEDVKAEEAGSDHASEVSSGMESAAAHAMSQMFEKFKSDMEAQMNALRVQNDFLQMQLAAATADRDRPAAANTSTTGCNLKDLSSEIIKGMQCDMSYTS